MISQQCTLLARRLIIVAAALILLVAGAFAVFVLRGSDAPPPPALSKPAATATAPPAADASAWEVGPSENTFVGYRVREEFASIGVADAVGRTGEVTGTATLEQNEIADAALQADMTTLVSDESRRDDALRERGIETGRFPAAEFELAGSAPIAFTDFAIEPPSVAGVVTVEDEGTLEFKFCLRPSG